ncbi:MazG family protein [Amnibacterium sp.]|uniref:nucleoside triphosphate pyrophosphohydrolase n=1 Tax=Amnibacterium sp. TaxID=1872496 RepID=UPI0026355935|nr:MazG family protein [Amnibacterium sp.]MCU1474104.1 nucleoside triphosphate pyrophosphohydrolase [Amnibacterium sp.]
MTDLPEVSTPELTRLVAVMARLRGPGGCPWDAEQTHESLVRYLIEETAELVEAIETGDAEAMREELGDVLYQVLFHADLAAGTPGEGFDLEDVAAATATKMIGRHPHVFGDTAAADAEAVVGVWEEQKRREKAHRTSVLDGVPMGMPSLLLAEKLLGRAARAGLEVRPSVEAPGDEEALGDALLDTVVAASAAGLDAERALRGAIRRLTTRIREAEAQNHPSP